MDIEKIKKTLENELADINISSVNMQDGQFYAEMEFYSNAGEDFVFTIWFDGTWSDFVNSFREYAKNFDPDEHVELWIPGRGTNGIPSSIRDLINDADSIDKFLNEQAETLKYNKYDDNWNKV